jgi:hypothetical protein
MAAERSLRGLLLVIGLTATATGLFAVAGGPDTQSDGGEVKASIDSEFRFFAAFWLAYGLSVLWVAARGFRDPATVRWVAAVLFGAGLARALAWVLEGQPAAIFILLLTLELVVPPLVLVLDRRVRAGR